MKRTALTLFLTSFLFMSSASEGAESATAVRPNLILIVTDDQGYGDMRQCPVATRYRSGVEIRFDQPVGPGGSLFHGTHGKLLTLRNAFRADPPELIKDPPDLASAKLWQGAENVARLHRQNWLDCIRTRQSPNAPVAVGHRTATVCHLANIARGLRRRPHWAPDNETFLGDEEATALLSRPRRGVFDLP